MARLTCNRSGWATVQDPVTEERISVDSDVSPEQASRLADEYDPIEYESDESDDSEADESDDEPDGPTCAGNDGECSRPVDEPGDYCWQHSE